MNRLTKLSKDWRFKSWLLQSVVFAAVKRFVKTALVRIRIAFSTYPKRPEKNSRSRKTLPRANEKADIKYNGSGDTGLVAFCRANGLGNDKAAHITASGDRAQLMLFCALEGSDDDEYDDSPLEKFERQPDL